MGKYIIPIMLLFTVLAMAIVCYVRRKKYGVPLWKIAVIVLTVAAVGIAGAMLMSFVENGRFGGVSFYGSIFLVPLAFVFLAKPLKMPIGQLEDYAMASACLALIPVKASCLLSGCCVGIVLAREGDRVTMRFPSPIAEMLLGVAIFVFLLWAERSEKSRGLICPLFLFTYGFGRFILNFFRARLPAFVWFIPAGHFWSLISMAIGATLFFLVLRRRKQEAA